MTENSTKTDNDTIDVYTLIAELIKWIRFLLTKWILIALLGILGGVGGVIYSIFLKPDYTATLTFALEDDKSNGGGLTSALGIASTLGLDLGTSAGGAFTGNNLLELMKSRKVVEKSLLKAASISSQVSLLDYYLEFTEMDKTLKKKSDKSILKFPPSIVNQPHSIGQDSVIEVVYRKLLNESLLIFQNDKKVSIITVEVKSKNEFFSKALAESLVHEVSDFYIETKSKKSKINVDILEYQTDSIRRELNNAISGVASANDNVYNLNTALNVYRVPSSKRQVDVQANTAILTQLVTNLELAKVTLRKETPLIQLIDTPKLPLSKTKLGKTKAGFIGGILGGLIAVVFVSLRAKTIRKHIN